MLALARSAVGRTALLRKPPISFSSASQQEPQKPSASCPVSRLVPPTQSATGPSLGLIPPTGSYLSPCRSPYLRTASAQSCASCLAPIAADPMPAQPSASRTASNFSLCWVEKLMQFGGGWG